MPGKRILTLSLIAWLLVQPVTVVSTKEAGEKILVFKAEPVSTREFAKEWKDHRKIYPIIYSLLYGLLFFK